MKKAYTRGEKWLFASPLLFLVIAGVAWVREQNQSKALVKQQTQTRGIALSPRLISLLTFSPDSRRVVVFNDNQSGVGAYGAVYDVKTRTKIRDLVPPKTALKNWQVFPYHEPLWSPNHKEILVRAATSTKASLSTIKLLVWDINSGTVKANHTHTGPVRDFLDYLRYSPDGKTLIGHGNPPAAIDVATGKLLSKPIRDRTNDGIYGWPNKRLGLIASADYRKRGDFRVVDAKTKKVVWQPQPPLIRVDDFRWFGDLLSVYGPQHERIIGVDKYVDLYARFLWDGRTRQLLPAPPSEVGDVVGEESFNPDNRSIAYMFQHFTLNGKPINGKNFLVAWDYRMGRELWRVETPNPLRELDWSPDGKWLMARGFEGRNRILYVFDSKGKMRFMHSPVSNLIRWSPDSKKLAYVAYRTDWRGKTTSPTLEIFDMEEENATGTPSQ